MHGRVAGEGGGQSGEGAEVGETNEAEKRVPSGAGEGTGVRFDVV